MKKIAIYDTTLRDGSQTEGISYSLQDKINIAKRLDDFGIDFIEGGWPFSNPKDTELFNYFKKQPLNKSKLAPFGSTAHPSNPAAKDKNLLSLIKAGTEYVTIFGKTWDLHVKEVLRIKLDDNLKIIHDSVKFLVKRGKKVFYDAEHFFDGYKANPDYALACLKAAYDAGARWVVLCDTNGGTLPAEMGAITATVIASGIPGDHLGIHTHDDTGNAVAGTLAAVDAGARQIQGTLNGLGERCGNANLVTLIPTLLLKEPYASRFEIGVPPDALKTLTRTSRMLDDILNRVPLRAAPYVGASAFAHKAGLHASAIVKDPTTYEHIAPEAVGNARIVPMSNQAGQSNLLRRLSEMGIEAEKGDAALSRILDAVKQRETDGYAYDSAQASFELLARRELGLAPDFFEVERYRVITERRRNARGEIVVESEAVVTVSTREGSRTSFFKNEHAQDIQDDGPVNALWQALKTDLGPYQAQIEDMRLTDFRVRITQGGTEAVTRVIIDFADDQGRAWATVGVSANIVDASFEALVDAITWKLVRDGAEAA